MALQLDYSLHTPEERTEFVRQLLEDTPDSYLNNKTLTYLSDYILFVGDKDQTKKERKTDRSIITRNREATIDKRQVSYEGMVATLENGEDGLYTMIRQDKNQILDHRDPITENEVKSIPGMREYMDAIEQFKVQFEKATGAARWALKRAIIETWQQAYILKASWQGLAGRSKPTGQIRSLIRADIPSKVYLDEEKIPRSTARLSLLVPTHVSFLLCYYSALKEECYDDLQSDLHFLLLDLERLVDDALKEEYPILYDITI